MTNIHHILIFCFAIKVEQSRQMKCVDKFPKYEKEGLIYGDEGGDDYAFVYKSNIND